MGIEDVQCVWCKRYKSTLEMETQIICKECAPDLEGKEVYEEDLA